ncbi:3-keto-5-aminohexanoate cleavage enzyme [Tepidibacter aestuarii]|uniref:3-keto-5-aminohexanoate cleavage enzyme n=1 Tax=Tepidibacter aestuarii TaxID=2925782 RepID=UPI0020BFF435|nr:3-keto-5-aminohexanoate cleavage protein [Tepidibacter aestuarii]CAH2214249.1 3-keto-5-aminohexanoate cleavage enzyme [Tepidibacter aestuarii]
MDKLIITAAICGAEVTKAHNPTVPYTVKEIGDEAQRAYEAGASIIHLHVREDNGQPTQNIERFRACINEIKNRCPDVIIQPSTGGAVGMSNEERLQPIYLDPEMATLDCGTCNFGGDDIFVNSENTIKEFAIKMKEINIKPEIEVFDKGMIDTAIRLFKKGYIDDNMHFNFVMGVNGGISASCRDLLFLKGSIPKNATFTVAGIGRYEFEMAALSILLGGHVRVGFEDNVYISKGVLAKSNAELVEKAVKISKVLGREIASCDEARKILKLKG